MCVRKGIIASVVFIVVFLVSAASAIQIGKTVEYNNNAIGKVIFDGTVHHQEGLHCMKCHNQYFIPKIGAARITYEDHAGRRKFCFGCHNGIQAFDAVSSCTRCHKKEG